MRWSICCMILGVFCIAGATYCALQHEETWVLLVNAARGWENYRHSANTLAMYRAVRLLGVPRSRILLFQPTDVAYDSINGDLGHLWLDRSATGDIGDLDLTRDPVDGHVVQADLSNLEVSSAAILNALTGTPGSGPVLGSSTFSHVLVYITGHSGLSFVKVQRWRELTSQQLGDAINNMHATGRFARMLLVMDTCHAESLYEYIAAPDVVAIGSSLSEEHSFSLYHLGELGVAGMDAFSFMLWRYLESGPLAASAQCWASGGECDTRLLRRDKLSSLYSALRTARTQSTTVLWDARSTWTLAQADVVDFFGDSSAYHA